MDNGVKGGAVEFEVLILGAGPAGLQLGHHLSRAGRSYLILEAGDRPGAFFQRFPRHRTLISSNKVYTGYDDPEVNLRWDWNSLLTEDGSFLFKEYSRKYFPPADKLVQYLGDYAQCYNLNVRCNTRIVRVERLPEGTEGFRLVDPQGNAFTGRRLVVAAGVTQPYVPEIPGVELADNYVDVSVDPNDFIDQKVMIIGKGNSAFETADNLIETAAVLHVCSPSPVNLAWKTHFVGHLRAVNNNFLDTYQLKSQNAVLDATIERIHRNEEGKLVATLRYTHACGEVEEIAYDRIILCTGFRFDNTIFAEDCRPELTLNDRFPAQTCEWESTNVPGIYFAGTLTQARDYKKGTSGFIHGFRYNTRALFRMLEAKHYGHELPSRPVEPTAEGLMLATLKRINRTSALWQQFGQLHDLIVLSDGGGPARHYEELPLAYIHETSLSASSHYYTFTLEFGKVTGDPFAIDRAPVVEKARESVFLHPVIRRWNGPLLVAEYHLLEDLDGEWKKPEAHLAPLRDFFAAQLQEARVRA
jgi:thioredoxin reductase